MLSQRTARLTSSLIRDILAAAQRPGMISFAGGLPASETLALPRLEDVPDGVMQYGPSEGEPALREAVAERARAMGMRCDASQVLILTGSQQGIDLVSKLLIDPGTPVLLEAPTYLAALQSFQFFGADCRSVALGEHGPDLDALRAGLAAKPAFAYLIPTFQNPSGRCYDAAHRDATAEALDAQQVLLVEDDPYRELVYDEACERTPLCARLTRAPWIYLGSFSKTLAPGLRVGYLIASPELFPYLLKLKQAADLHSNRLSQWLVLSQLQGDFAGHLARLRALYRERRDQMHAALSEQLGEAASWQCPPGGLFFWLQLNTPGIDTRTLLPEAMARGLAFMPGEPFFPNAPAAVSAMRLNFSHSDPASLHQGVRLLAELLHEQQEG